MTLSPPNAPEYTPQARAERLIALGRLILACFSLIAIYLDPSTPAHYQQTTYTLLSGYSVYALAMLVVAWRRPVPSRRQRLVSHVVDLILFTLFIYLTEGPASPFFLYFVFSLFCATLRFRWRGIVITGAAATLIYTGMAVLSVLLGDVAFESSRFAVRIAYLGVITALLSYLGVYQEQLRAELASLAAWPHEIAPNLEATLRRSLAHVAAIVNAPRVLFVWEEAEEPWLYIALWADGDLRIDRAPPGRHQLAQLHDSSFLIDPESPGSTLVLTAGTLTEQVIDPAGDALRRDYSITTALGVTVESESLTGRVFALDVTNATADDLVLAHIAARLLLASLEQFFFVQQVRQTASAEERLRIARDLHDGVIQSLSGIGLQLESIRLETARDPKAASDRIAQVQRVLEGEQRELRDLVRELRPTDLRRDGAADLNLRLRQIAERYLLEWGMSVAVRPAMVTAIPATTALEIYRIVNESLSNAARHGRASRAEVAIAVQRDSVRIRVSDNGSGFGFAGRRDLPTLEKTGQGPKTLKERLVKLGGELVVDSSPAGAAIEASFPLARGAHS